LILSYDIVKAHGGKLDVESNTNLNNSEYSTTFILTLPLNL
jgi:signal transduction histidine kinase